MNGPGAVCLVPVVRRLVTESFTQDSYGPRKALELPQGVSRVVESSLF